MQSIDECFPFKNEEKQANIFQNYVDNIDEHINLRIAAGIKKGINLVLEKIDQLVVNKVELALSNKMPLIVDEVIEISKQR